MENQIILYQTESSNVNLNVKFYNESFWLTQKNIAQLFGVEVPVISKDFKNIFESCELMKFPLFPKWKQLPLMGKKKHHFITLTQSLLLVIG